MRIRTRLSLIPLAVLLVPLGCAKEERAGGIPVPLAAQGVSLSGSLHGTDQGLRTWYESGPDSLTAGFESLTHVSFDRLTCGSCHVVPADCGDCHASRADTPADDKCLVCHNRQKAEIDHGLTDVHRAAGLRCADCHGATELHGDGNRYTSLLQPGAVKVRCENCHPPDSLEVNSFHAEHVLHNPAFPISCAACHVQSVVMCNNCHFDGEVAGGREAAAAEWTGLKFLVKRTDTGQIDAADVQTVVYQDSIAMIALAPDYAHSISRNAITACSDCHGNEYVHEYNRTGAITVSKWDPSLKTVVPNIQGKGIIPVPPDWPKSLKFDFETIQTPGNPPVWKQEIPKVIGRQMLFGQPLKAMPPGS